ncbi:hypothetical protein FN846DRAFT_907009 [Sphaerosporella brunnea]|uniref:Uncharacterized protein n=1 Tax=Sphaerosporella brunnea TaxID=1250544 RepID=A0A5J5EWR8_9PEZI|nr:hypothetical protein FN846DRAFT_907009 [Sphaerosporella brunnea]
MAPLTIIIILLLTSFFLPELLYDTFPNLVLLISEVSLLYLSTARENILPLFKTVTGCKAEPPPPPPPPVEDAGTGDNYQEQWDDDPFGERRFRRRICFWSLYFVENGVQRRCCRCGLLRCMCTEEEEHEMCCGECSFVLEFGIVGWKDRGLRGVRTEDDQFPWCPL